MPKIMLNYNYGICVKVKVLKSESMKNRMNTI